MLCGAGEIACKGRQDFYLGNDGGMIPVRSKNGHEMRIHFERLVGWYGRNSSFQFTSKTTYSIFLLVSSKILVFAESFGNWTMNRARNRFKMRVILQGPHEGDHMANGRVGMAVQGVKRQQCRTLRISLDDTPILSWRHRFCSATHEQHENWCGWKKRANLDELVEDGESQWLYLEKSVVP